MDVALGNDEESTRLSPGKSPGCSFAVAIILRWNRRCVGQSRGKHTAIPRIVVALGNHVESTRPSPGKSPGCGFVMAIILRWNRRCPARLAVITPIVGSHNKLPSSVGSKQTE
ncbi:hypothetical protein J6590_007980 [Homalodisca vitripennis]|nr:hypothetical protein J6590_007980 [Homalodisca vitripennis]